eukprot:6804328-Prorocentrum_lima.AAC.1
MPISQGPPPWGSKAECLLPDLAAKDNQTEQLLRGEVAWVEAYHWMIMGKVACTWVMPCCRRHVSVMEVATASRR